MKLPRSILLILAVSGLVCFIAVICYYVTLKSSDSRSKGFSQEQWSARYTSQNRAVSDVFLRYSANQNKKRTPVGWDERHSHTLEHGLDFLVGRDISEFPEMCAVAGEPVNVSTFENWRGHLTHHIWPYEDSVIKWINEQEQATESQADITFYLFLVDSEAWSGRLPAYNLSSSDLLLISVADGKITGYRLFSRFETESQKQKRIDGILADLKSEDRHTHLTAIKAMGDDPKFWAGIPDLIEALNSEEDTLKIAAASKLSRIAREIYSDYTKPSVKPPQLPELEPALDPLLRILSGNESDETRRTATEAVANITLNLGDDVVEKVMPALIKAISDSSESVSDASITAVGILGPKAESAVPALIEQIKAGGRKTEDSAVALGKIHSRPEISVPALLEALKRTPSQEIVEALGEFSLDAKAAIPVLSELLSQGKKLDHGKFDGRIELAHTLGRFGPAAESAAPLLEQLYHETGRQSCLADLACLGTDGKARARKLIQNLREFQVGNMPNQVELLTMLAEAKTLTILDLQYSELRGEELAPLARMTQLEELILPEFMTDAGLSYISALTNLKTLRVRNSHQVTDEGLKQLQNLENLRTLGLGYCGTSDDGLQYLGGLHSLRELLLGGNQIGDAGVARLVKDHPDLESLDLSGTQVSAASVENLIKLKKLRMLGIMHTPLNGRYPGISPASQTIAKGLPNCQVICID